MVFMSTLCTFIKIDQGRGMKEVIVFGVGQLAEVAYFYLKNDSPYKVVAFTVDEEFINTPSFHQLPVVPFESLETLYSPERYVMSLPLSYKGVNAHRKDKYLEAKSKGYRCISYVHSKARNYASSIGENCFIFEDNVIQPYTKIGNNCILWSGNHIGHHSIIKDHCFVASHVVISGGVTIGERTFIGVNATFRDNITIGAENVVGAGAIIMRDTDDRQVFVPKATSLYKKSSDQLTGF